MEIVTKLKRCLLTSIKTGADLVALIVHNDETCGIAFTGYSGAGEEYAFSVTNRRCVNTDDHYLAHNIGHNLGCQHNNQSVPIEENTIGFGYQVRCFVSM